jgi:catechol 2,3-dioxygenase-like lactoylglutathione lyase family enzyme
MKRAPIFALALMLAVGAHGASAQGVATGNAASLRVRYIVEDVPAAIAFYGKLGFKVEAQAGGNFAVLSRGALQLLLNPTKGTGGASQPMPNGQRPAPGGWNRIVLNTADLQGEVDRLRKEGVHFRNDIITGLGGKQILLDDPSGNPIELFQPG